MLLSFSKFFLSLLFDNETKLFQRYAPSHHSLCCLYYSCRCLVSITNDCHVSIFHAKAQQLVVLTSFISNTESAYLETKRKRKMSEEDDFAPESTEGYKKPKEATLEQMKILDANDESLNKWKESLIKNVGGPADDPRRVVILKLTLEVQERSDISIELHTPALVEAAKGKVFTIKEGCDYRLKILFKVQHEIVTGLKYVHVVKRMGVKVDKADEMLGSYGPSLDPYEKKFPMEQAPSGMMAIASAHTLSHFS